MPLMSLVILEVSRKELRDAHQLEAMNPFNKLEKYPGRN